MVVTMLGGQRHDEKSQFNIPIGYRTIESLCHEGVGLAGLQGGVLGTIAQNRSLNAISTKIDA